MNTVTEIWNDKMKRKNIGAALGLAIAIAMLYHILKD
jgi:hypothetical protein